MKLGRRYSISPHKVDISEAFPKSTAVGRVAHTYGAVSPSDPGIHAPRYWRAARRKHRSSPHYLTAGEHCRDADLWGGAYNGGKPS